MVSKKQSKKEDTTTNDNKLHTLSVPDYLANFNSEIKGEFFNLFKENFVQFDYDPKTRTIKVDKKIVLRKDEIKIDEIWKILQTLIYDKFKSKKDKEITLCEQIAGTYLSLNRDLSRVYKDFLDLVIDELPRFVNIPQKVKNEIRTSYRDFYSETFGDPSIAFLYDDYGEFYITEPDLAYRFIDTYEKLRRWTDCDWRVNDILSEGMQIVNGDINFIFDDISRFLSSYGRNSIVAISKADAKKVKLDPSKLPVLPDGQLAASGFYVPVP